MAELDFSWLNSITQEGRVKKPAPPENRPAGEAQNGTNGTREYKSMSEDKNPPQSHQEADRGNRILEDREAARKRDHDRSVQVYKDHQAAIKATEEAQAEILKGLRTGADPVGLLLKAIEAISKMTGNAKFYNQARGDLIAVYGEAMLYPLPIQWEIDEAMQRFEKILASMTREHDPEVAARIEASAKAHYLKIEKLQALLEQAQAAPAQ